ncbi:MAG: hypothetical protein EOO10_24785 [Chitinophagaceae bacterium]|nr:MAG: hypothetical protein EOO10_24785 [Chitinophagaceae bacterium]
MELDDLKKAWEQSTENNLQQHTTDKIIDSISNVRYKSQIKKIVYPEIAGSLICLMAVVFIGWHFYKLDNLFLQGVGIACIVLLIALSALSLLSLRHLTGGNNFSRPHADTLKDFTRQKLAFYKLQKINVTLCYLLLVTVIILMWKFFAGKDLTGNKSFWIFSFTLGYVFLLLFSQFVTKYYKNTLSKSEELLRELES